MESKAKQFLLTSSVLVCLLCVCIFSSLAVSINQKSEDTISEVGQIYMSGMSEQITLHFATTIEARFNRLHEICADAAEADAAAASELLHESAEASGFEYLALCSESGDIQMLYGDQVYMIYPESFFASLNRGEKKLALGRTLGGAEVAMFGVAGAYPMADGTQSVALLAGLSASDISHTLSLDEDDGMVYSHVIRRNGTFVIRSAGADDNNYFDRIRSLFREFGGENPEKYNQELYQAMLVREDYSTVMHIGSELKHIYCSPLPYSEWYLVTVMPYSSLDMVLNDMIGNVGMLMIASCGLVLLMLVFVFAKYAGLLRRHMNALDAARQEALAANRAKSEFLSNMSHDIRTPMNAVVGMTAIAIANIDDQRQVQNCLNKIALSSRHLLGLINNVLDMSKIESGRLTLNLDQISLREVMDNIVSIVQPQVKMKNQSFNITLRDIEQENVVCDSVRLNQILLNMLSNAIKFTPDGGAISLILSEEPSPRGEDLVRVHLRVKDNGIGMSPEFKEKLFESFAREDIKRVHKTEGTGLGMAITKYIVDAMQGQIEVESEPGLGTEFHLTVDLERATLAEVDMTLPNRNILVVDDDRLLCSNTVGALRSIGLTADSTLDGETALKMARERRGTAEEYQIIMLDWKLPGIDGIETARRLRAELGAEPVILLVSSYDCAEIQQEARAAGIDGFISKPLFKSTLFYALRQYSGVEAEAAQDEAEQQFDFTGRRVLLAEDNDLNWEIARELLSELGLELERAENGQLCLDKFLDSPVGYWDAILMDIRMPVMNGYETAEAIRLLGRADANLPIIAMTADAFTEDIQRCLEHGMNAHLAKPINVDEVARLLEKYFAEADAKAKK